YCWEPHHENPHVQHPEESLRCHAASHYGSEMNPQADKKANRREANEEPKEGSDPIWNGVGRRGKVRNRSRCIILQQNITIGSEQCRTGRAGRVAMNCNGLAFQVTNELLSFVLGWKFALVAP